MLHRCVGVFWTIHRGLDMNQYYLDTYLTNLTYLTYLIYLPNQHKSFAELCNNADSTLFKKMMANTNHVLHHLLPPVKNLPYEMRPRAHNRCLPASLRCCQKKPLSIGCSIKTRFNPYVLLLFNLFFLPYILCKHRASVRWWLNKKN